MLTQQLALVPDGVNVKLSEVIKVASALSKQVARDFGPIWNTKATVDAFASLDEVPNDYWPIIIMAHVEGAAGFHEDDHGQPFALVEFGPEWSLTASHECLEMLADPFGRRLRAGMTPDQARKVGEPNHRVRFLVEVCDPSESANFAYQVNGVTVSDFYTPAFFDPMAVASVRYSFTGAIKAPRTVLRDGYLSWHDSETNHWMQLRMFPDELSTKIPHVVDLSKQTAFASLLTRGVSIRSAVDRVTRTPQRVEGAGKAMMASLTKMAEPVDEAAAAQANMWRANVKALVAQAKGDNGASSTGTRKGRK
jgi:hypothetical protein